MKKMMKSLLILGLLIGQANAQEDLLNSLYGSQTTTSPSGVVTTNTTSPSFTTSSATVDTKNCLSENQNVLPLSILKGLLRTKGEDFKVVHDAKSGQLKIQSGPMISNCKSMLEWQLSNPTTENPNYIVQVKIRSSYDCDSNNVCKYKVTSKENGSVIEKEYSGKPTLASFMNCLKEETGLKAGGIDTGKIVSEDVDVMLSGAFASAKDVLMGAKNPEVKVVYNKVSEDKNNCMVYESIRKEPVKISSFNESERERLDEEAKGVCETENYKKISEFVTRYKEYESSLGKIRNELILKEVKKIAAKIKAGDDLKDVDFSTIDDFGNLIVNPLVGKASELYWEISKLGDGSEKKEKQKQFDAIIVKLKAFKKEPYITGANNNVLIEKGFFEEAEKVNDIRLTLEHSANVGKKIDNVLITPVVAQQKIDDSHDDFAGYLKEKRKEYEVKTGQVTGKSSFYATLASKHRKNIETRTANYQKAVNDEILKMTNPQMCPQGSGSLCGYCFKAYFRNAAKCVQEATTCINDLKIQLQKLNNADSQIASDLDTKANQYSDWEDEGQRYIAKENGEEEETTTDEDDETTTSASVEAPNSNTNYSFDFNNPNYQQPTTAQQQNPYFNQFQQYQQQQMPYMNYFGQQNQQPWAQTQQPWGQQSPWGQQANFNFGAQGQMGWNGQPNYYPQAGFGNPQQPFNPMGSFSGQYGSPYQQMGTPGSGQYSFNF